MTHPSPSLPTAELDPSLMLDRIVNQDAALARIEQIAAEACGKQPATVSAMQACDLLHHAAREREEIGYLPPDTVDDAVRLARHARSHVARITNGRSQEFSR